MVINLIPLNWTRPTGSQLVLDVASAAPLIDDTAMPVKLHVQDAIDTKGLLLRGRLHSDENGACDRTHRVPSLPDGNGSGVSESSHQSATGGLPSRQGAATLYGCQRTP